MHMSLLSNLKRNPWLLGLLLLRPLLLTLAARAASADAPNPAANAQSEPWVDPEGVAPLCQAAVPPSRFMSADSRATFIRLFAKPVVVRFFDRHLGAAR